jgi:hypothetical protein
MEADGAGDAVGGGEVVGRKYPFELFVRWTVLDVEKYYMSSRDLLKFSVYLS